MKNYFQLWIKEGNCFWTIQYFHYTHHLDSLDFSNCFEYFILHHSPLLHLLFKLRFLKFNRLNLFHWLFLLIFILIFLDLVLVINKDYFHGLCLHLLSLSSQTLMLTYYFCFLFHLCLNWFSLFLLHLEHFKLSFQYFQD